MINNTQTRDEFCRKIELHIQTIYDCFPPAEREQFTKQLWRFLFDQIVARLPTGDREALSGIVRGGKRGQRC